MSTDTVMMPHGEELAFTVSTLGVTLRSSWLCSKLLQRPGLPKFLSADSLCHSVSVAAVFLEAGTEAENKIFQHWLYDTPKINIRKLRAFLEMQRPERLPCPPPWKASRIDQEGLCGLQCALTGQGFQPATHHSLRKSASEKKSCSNDPRWRDTSAPPPGFRPGGRADAGPWWRWTKRLEISGFREWVLCPPGSIFRQLPGAGCFLAQQPGGGRWEGMKEAKSTRWLSPSLCSLELWCKYPKHKRQRCLFLTLCGDWKSCLLFCSECLVWEEFQQTAKSSVFYAQMGCLHIQYVNYGLNVGELKPIWEHHPARDSAQIKQHTGGERTGLGGIRMTEGTGERWRETRNVGAFSENSNPDSFKDHEQFPTKPI